MCDDGGGGPPAPVVVRMNYLFPTVALSRACAQKSDRPQTPTSGRMCDVSRSKTLPKLPILDLPGNKRYAVVKAP